MRVCTICDAKFGKKLDPMRCSICGEHYCRGHFVKTDQLVYHKSLMLGLQPQSHGVCTSCLLQIWQKNDAVMQPATGVLGRTKKWTSDTLDNMAVITRLKVDPLQKIKLVPDAGVQIVHDKAWMVFLHQKDITKEFILQNLIETARIKAVGEGRSNERDFCLADVYTMVDWLKSHPKLPSFTHNITWDKLERTPQGLSIFNDAWHLTFTALAFSNPVIGAIEAAKIAYHVGDRVVDQATGKSIINHAYDGVLSKVGLNFNPVKAITIYLAGNMILQLYRKRS